ncbi:MAG: NUMOD4 domain-containing protein [Bacteroidota bacterium]
MKEIWKDIPEYKGTHQASTLGRIKSLDRYDNRGRLRKGIILKTRKDKDGYHILNMSKNGVVKTRKLHRMIYSAFKELKDGFVIDHDDNNKDNNKLSNLKQITVRKNTSKDRFRQKYSSKYIGVSRSFDKWRAIIHINGVSKNLGSFNTEIEASNTYQKELKKYE